MKSHKIHRVMATFLAGFPLLLLAGCFELDVETSIREDGSGERRMELMLPIDDQDEEEAGLTIDDFQALFGFTKTSGWSRTVVNNNSEMVHAFKRLSKTDDLANWAQPRSDIHIKGTLEGGPYNEVAFRNSVQVRTEKAPGGRSFIYREKFFWEGLGEALINDQVEAYRESLRIKYPELSPERMGELMGLFKGGYWAAVEEGMYEMSDAERARRFHLLVDRVKEQATKTVRKDHPEADEQYLSDMVFKIIIDRDERDEDFLEEKLLGATLALLTELRIRVNMPGEIVNSNAASQEGNILTWRIEPGNAVDYPIEIFAESVLSD